MMTRDKLKSTIINALEALHLSSKPYLKTFEVAQLLGVSRSQVNNLVTAKKLHPFKNSEAYNSPHLFRTEDIISYYVDNTILPTQK